MTTFTSLCQGRNQTLRDLQTEEVKISKKEGTALEVTGATDDNPVDSTKYIGRAEKAMAPHSRALAWRIPGTGKPGGLPSMGSHRVGHD